jgi:Flp pilus assembly pilin Flp
MHSFKGWWKNFYHDEDGQTLVEYIVLLATVIGFAVLVVQKLIGPAFAALSQFINQSIDKQIFRADFHYFRFPRN